MQRRQRTYPLVLRQFFSLFSRYFEDVSVISQMYSSTQNLLIYKVGSTSLLLASTTVKDFFQRYFSLAMRITVGNLCEYKVNSY